MARTGRIFECLSKKGSETLEAEQYFTVGKDYKECNLDAFGNNMSDETSFLLYSDPVTSDGHGFAMYVSAMDFELKENINFINLN